MARNELQKLKLLYLYEYLWKNSAEDSPMTTQNLLTFVSEKMGENYTRETLIADIKALNEHGYEIAVTKVGRQKAYYVPEREFETGELKILMDAVQAASFISQERTDELMKKIAALAGPYKAKILRDNIVCFNTQKHKTKSLYASVEVLEQSIEQQQKAGFYYYDRDERGDKKYHHDKKRYLVDPIALVYSTDNYYLLTWNVEAEKPFSYRIDRMDTIELSNEPVDHNAVIARDNVADFTRRVFRMFSGESERVTLEFTEKIMRYVYDKFGEETQIEKIDDDCYRTIVDVQVSPTFFGWIFQFAGNMKLISPESAVDQYREHVENVWNSFGAG